jgi:hypothetical protein
MRADSYGRYTPHSPIADGFVHQFRCYSAINTTTDGANNSASRAAQLSDSSYLFADKFFLEQQRRRIRQHARFGRNLPSSNGSCNHIYYEQNGRSQLSPSANASPQDETVYHISASCYGRRRRRARCWYIQLHENPGVTRTAGPHATSRPMMKTSLGNESPYFPRKETRTCISSPSPSNNASTPDPSPILEILTCAEPYSLWSQAVTLPFRFQASS